MDPALWELLETGERQDEVAAIVRLDRPERWPEGVRRVTQFGNIATVRLPRQAIPEVWAEDAVASLKAPRVGLMPEPDWPELDGIDSADSATLRDRDRRRGEGLRETGRGVVLGVIDWGFDVVHPEFVYPDGSTRILALWDQRNQRDQQDQRSPSPRGSSRAPQPYGYGVVHRAEAINQALESDDPYEALGYRPAPRSHGTHVASIAGGNGRAGGPQGVAPGVEFVFVHLSNLGPRQQANLGDSATLLEAVDFIAKTAGDRPCVINTSLGRHGEQHDGSTLVEQGLDAFVSEVPGRAVVQSCGNYYSRDIHTCGRLKLGETRRFTWHVDPADLTPNELEVWYSGQDRLVVELRALGDGPSDESGKSGSADDPLPNGPDNAADHPPDNAAVVRAELGDRVPITHKGQAIGSLYHRRREPNTQDNHIDIFLYPYGPEGDWEVTLRAVDIVDGSFHVWIERDSALPGSQSRLDPDDVVPSYTTGTICNGFHTIAVAAYDPRSPQRAIAPFSSAGPTRDKRQKPDCAAPGVAILAARSTDHWQDEDAPLLMRKSGTSMAAPHVAGTVALMFEAAGRPLPIPDTRRLLLRHTDPTEAYPPERVGSGYLNSDRAVAASREYRAHSTDARDVMSAYTPEAQPHADAIDAVALDVTEARLPEASATHNFILISGGPGLFDNRDVEHDKSWANYVTPPLLLTDTAAKRNAFFDPEEEVWWFVYKPAYIRRWEDDVKQGRKATKDVRAKGFSSYVDLIEGRADQRGWNLAWFDSADDLWRKLKTFSDPFSRVWYWGHASGGLWLTLAHSARAEAVAPQDHEIITVESIAANSSLKARFKAAKLKKLHRFIGCNSDRFARAWALAFGVTAEGFEGKVDFSAIHKTGGEPSLVDPAKSRRFLPDGTAAEQADFQEDAVSDALLNFDDEASLASDFDVADMEPVAAQAAGYEGNYDGSEDEGGGSVVEAELEASYRLYDALLEEAAALNDSESCAHGEYGDEDDLEAGDALGWDTEASVLSADAAYPDREHEEAGDTESSDGYDGESAAEYAAGAVSDWGSGDSIVDQADWAIAAEAGALPIETWLASLVPPDALADSATARDVLPLHPAAIFDAFVHGSPALRRYYEQFFDVVATPGQPVDHLAEGQVVLRRAWGEGLAHAAMLVSGEVIPQQNLTSRGLSPESASGGGYAHVLEAGPLPHGRSQQFARRIVDAAGYLPTNQMVLQVKPGRAVLPSVDGFGDGGEEGIDLLEAGPRTTFRIRNRIISQDGVRDCDVALSPVGGTGGSASGRTNRFGSWVVDLSALPDGDYRLQVTPDSATAAPVGPAIATASPRPDRIWRALDTPVTLTGGRLASPHAAVAVSGRTVTVGLQPVWMASPNRSARPANTPITHIVVHHTAGTQASSALNTFMNPATDVSAHYVIDTDGQVIKMVHETEQAWQAGRSHWAGRDGVNDFSVGIEVVHRSGSYPAAQYTALIDLLQQIRASHPTIAAQQVIGHSDVATTRDSPRRVGRKLGDPGPNFEWSQLEAAGLGLPLPSVTRLSLMPRLRQLGFAGVIYGDFFQLVPGGRLRSGDRDSTQRFGGRTRSSITTAVIEALQQDLQSIGYFCPVDGGFGQQTLGAVKAFQEHFLGGVRHGGQVDEATAEAIKFVRP